MAEKYGNIPPRFTKEWWGYFWYYYKWRVIGIAFAAAIVIVTIVQCASRPKYDMYITYAGHKAYSDNLVQVMQDSFNEHITDIDGNGHKSVMFRQMTFYENAGSEEMDSAMQTKLDFTFTDDCSYIYFMDRVEAEIYINRESAQRLFADTQEWAKDTDAEILTAQDGTGYAVNLKDSSFFKERELYCEDLYLLIRTNTKDDEKNKQAYEDSLKIAEILLK